GADVFPVTSAVAGAEIGENAVDGVTVGEAAARGPEGDAVVEGEGILVLELHGPGGAAVGGFVDPTVGGIVPDGLEVCSAFGDSEEAAELECLGARDDASGPGLAAVGGLHKGAVTARGPDHALVHRADGDQAIGGVAVLCSQFGLADFVLREGQGGADND